MSYFDELKNSISDLFWSAVGDSHNEDEIKEMLDGIDFHALAQATIHRGEIVYEYKVNCALPLAMNYRERNYSLALPCCMRTLWTV